MFQVDLKACLGSVLPNHLIIISRNQGWFLGGVILWPTPTHLWSLLYSTTILYDTTVLYDNYSPYASVTEILERLNFKTTAERREMNQN